MKTHRYGHFIALGCFASMVLACAASGTPTTNRVLDFSAPWRYATNDLGAANWISAAYDDSGWLGPGGGLFYIESSPLPAAKRTPLPPGAGDAPLPCYYFRTSFTLAETAGIVKLIITHLVDDGAVFYLDGQEIQRVRMASGVVEHGAEASGSPSGGDATALESFTVVGSALARLKKGENVLAVRVHQHGTASSDVVFGAQVSTVSDPEPVIQLTRGPYLQVCTPSSIVIRWRTDLEESSLVRCGTGLENLSHVSYAGAPVTEHEVAVTNLLPDTLYYYSVGSDARVLAGGDATCSFRTHPLPGQPKSLRLWVTGDAGTANEDERAVRDAFESMNGTRAVHAWLQLGDNAYDEGTDAQYQAAMFDLFSSRLRQTPVWVTLANHETYSTDWNGDYPYLNIFTMPALGEAGGLASHTKLYYSFDIGMVHFVSLDSMVSGRGAEAAMASWLRADLASNTSRWLIAFFHHPPYTKGSHDSDDEIELIEMRENILPILEAGGADLVLCGHSHSYERSFLLNGHYGGSSSLAGTMILDGGSGRPGNTGGGYAKPENAAGTPVGNRGTVYAVVGCSGKTSGGALDHPAMYVSRNNLGSLVLDISTNRLDAIFLRETGATNDWFTLQKLNEAPVASNLSCTVEADASVELLLGAADINRNPLTYAIERLPTNGLVSAFSPASGALVYTPARGGTNSDSIRFVASDGKATSSPGAVSISVRPPPDADGDGMPDAWETQNGVTDSSADADSDGATNGQEYRAGTDPRDARSWLRMTESKPETSSFRVTWASVGGTRYRVLYSDGGPGGGFTGEFTPLPRAVAEEMDPRAPGVPGTMSFADDFVLTGAPPHGGRYYRVSVVR